MHNLHLRAWLDPQNQCHPFTLTLFSLKRHALGVPNEPITLTPGAAFFVGMGFARWIASKSDGRTPIAVSVGRDPRMR